MVDGIGLLHVENNLLKERIKNLEASEASAKEKASLNLKLYEAEIRNNQILKDREKIFKDKEENSDLVNKFMMKTLQNIELETKELKKTIEKQNKLINKQEVENESLRQIVFSLESLMKEEENKKKRLQNIVKHEQETCEMYEIIGKLNVEAPDYLGFVNDMLKTIKTQHSQIEEYR